MVKDYDCEILYYPVKANMVVDALSHNATSALYRGYVYEDGYHLFFAIFDQGGLGGGIEKQNWKTE